MKKLDKNEIEIVGRLSTKYETYVLYNTSFVETFIEVERKMRNKTDIDVLIVNMSFRLYDEIYDKLFSNKVKLFGEIRTYSVPDKKDPTKSHSKLIVFVKSVEFTNENDKCEVLLTGTICKINQLRTTPFNRHLCDLIIACNYSKYKTSYVPSICWEKVAERIQTKKIGTKVLTTGRLHSRVYQKVLEDGTTVDKLAYEYSINTVEDVNDGGENND